MISTHSYCSFCGAANPTKSVLCFACHQPLHRADEESLYTELLNGRYRIVESVGTGGFGAVYRADDLQLARVVAIKQIRLRGLSSQQMIDATDTFNREVALLSGLSHPHLPRFYTHFSDAEHWYLAMEFIEGETLDAYLVQRGQSARQRTFSFDGVLDVGLQLCDVLLYLHTRQPAIIFRDLKPGNIMRKPSGHLYLIDFGISRRFTPGKQRDTIPLGSPGYAAPEQYGKAQTTPQADIYSLGALLHYLVTGNDPADNPFHFASAYSYGNLGMNELNTLILRMVEREASQRPGSIFEVKQSLERIVLQHTNWQSPVRKKVPLPVVSSSNIYTPNGSVSGQGNYATKQQQQMYMPSSQKPLQHPTRRKALIGLGAIGLTFIVGTEVFGSFHHVDPAPYVSQPPDYDPTQQDQSTPATNSGIQPLITYQGHQNTVLGVHWSNDGQTMTSIDQNVTQIWNAKTAITTTTYAFSYPSIARSDFAWSPDGTQIATLDNQIVSIWQLATGQKILSYSKHASTVNLVAWSPDGKYIASAGLDLHVLVWDAATGYSITDYTAHVYPIKTLVWAPDSTRLFSSDQSENMNIWGAISGKTLQEYNTWGQAGWSQTIITRAAWSSDGKQVAGQDVDGQVQACVTPDERPYLIKAIDGGVATQLVWSPDSRYIATTSDNIVQITNVQDSSIFAEYQGHTDTVYAVAWSPDGKYIASAGQDKTVQIWQLFPPTQ